MIQPGVARRDFSCGGCLANFYFATKRFPIFMCRNSLVIECPLCGYISTLRINANSEIEILDTHFDYNDFFQDENGDTFKKDQNGNFIPTSLP